MPEEIPEQPRVEKSKLAQWLGGHRGQTIGVVVGVLALVIAYLTYRSITQSGANRQSVSPTTGTSPSGSVPDTASMQSTGMDTLVSNLSQLSASEQALIQTLQNQHHISEGATLPPISATAPLTASSQPQSPITIGHPETQNTSPDVFHGTVNPPPPVVHLEIVSPPSAHPASSILSRRTYGGPGGVLSTPFLYPTPSQPSTAPASIPVVSGVGDFLNAIAKRAQKNSAYT